MKSPPRRLGRGLGAFLDFGPAGQDAAAYVSESLSSGTTSILETSAAAPPPPAPAPVPAPAPAAPASIARSIAAQPLPEPDDGAFIDDLVMPLTFNDVELE